MDDLAAGIDSNRKAKENIGLMTNGLFQHSMLLENAIFNGGMNIFWAKMLWNLYGYIIQDEAMRMIKHSDGKVLVVTADRCITVQLLSCLYLLETLKKKMFSGTVDEDGNSMNDGFLQNINKYWDGFNPEDKKQYASLKVPSKHMLQLLLHLYMSTINCSSKMVPGQFTGRISGVAPRNINLSVDIANRACINSVYNYSTFCNVDISYTQKVHVYLKGLPMKCWLFASLMV